MQMLIAGRGHLATALVEMCKNQGVKAQPWNDEIVATRESVLFHVGSGRQFREVLEWCSVTETPLVQAATGQNELLPHKLKCPVVIAPNLAVPVAMFFQTLPLVAEPLLRAGMQVVITESHQKRKRTVAGTAHAIATILNVPLGSIRSIREPSEQLERGVPVEHLDAHAYHWVTFMKGDSAIELSVKIDGLRPYIAGAIILAENMANKRHMLKNQIYTMGSILNL